jgi:FKBP-type peptidyl-prolyl cis-trans isomerase 2
MSDTTSPVGIGDMILLHYEVAFAEGDVFDSSYERKDPIELTIGSNSLLPKIEEALVGMEIGETQELLIDKMDAYGERDPEAIMTMELTKFPEELEIQEGMVLPLVNDDGTRFLGAVMEVTDTEVKMDINHPLKGQDLRVKVQIAGIISRAEVESEEAEEASDEEE